VVACNLILEYTLSAAVCARAFSAYGATLFGALPEAVLVHAGPFRLDPCAFALILLLGMLLARGTRESAAFNTGARMLACPGGVHRACTSVLRNPARC
jgi:APA family basic amino acid/polyamine antiporter